MRDNRCRGREVRGVWRKRKKLECETGNGKLAMWELGMTGRCTRKRKQRDEKYLAGLRDKLGCLRKCTVARLRANVRRAV